MERKLSGQVVVVTGGTAGVGRATARAFAQQGASVAVLARDPDALAETRRELERCGAPAHACSVDVADADAVEQAAQEIEHELGPIDVWVNNAMVSVFSPVRELTAAEVRRVTEVTYLGTVHGTLSALRRMRGRDRGVIVQVGSALSYQAIPLQAAYCASKFAIRAFTDALRIELRHDQSAIRTTMVQLPAHNTPQFRWVRSRLPNRAQPVPPIFQPEVAADAIVWASQNDRRELHVGWPAIRAIWGSRLAPWIAERYLARNGFESQQTDEPLPERADNLWTPVDGDMHAAHGAFDDRARGGSIALTISKHRRAAITTTAVVAAGAVAMIAGERR